MLSFFHLTVVLTVVYIHFIANSCFSESDGEDFSQGMHAFLSQVKARKQNRYQQSHVTTSDIGIEDRIIGALTFEKKFW